jgi:high-affinity iron transporter
LTLTLVVAVTVMREGTEIALFIYSISSAQNIPVQEYILGLAIGAVSGLLCGITIYWGLIKLASRYIFKVSSMLLILISAGLAADAAGILTSAGIIEMLSTELWDSSWFVADKTIPGQILNTVIGYNARPNGMQLLFYLTTIATIVICMKIKNKIKNKF